MTTLLAAFAPVSDAQTLARPRAGDPVRKVGSVPRYSMALAPLIAVPQTKAETSPVKSAISQRVIYSSSGNSKSNLTDVIIRIMEEDLAEGSITYSISGPCGGGSFTTSYSATGSPGPEDDNFQPDIPLFPGEVYTTMNDGDCSYKLEPAGTGPQTGTCPPVKVHFGPGAVVEISKGTEWTSSASGSFSSKTKRWELVCKEGKGEVAEGIYTSDFRVGSEGVANGGKQPGDRRGIPGVSPDFSADPRGHDHDSSEAARTLNVPSNELKY